MTSTEAPVQVPVTEGAEDTPKKPRLSIDFKNPKTLLKSGGGLLGAIVLLSLAGSLIGKLTGQPSIEETGIPLPAPSPMPTIAANASPTPNPSPTAGFKPPTNQWDTVEFNQNQTLLKMSEARRLLSKARGHKWLLHAQVQCEQMGADACRSPRQYLLQTLKMKYSEFYELTKTGEIPQDTDRAKQVRAILDDMEDISNAIAATPGEEPIPVILSSDLNSQIDNFILEADRLETLRASEAAQAYQGGSSNGNQ